MGCSPGYKLQPAIRPTPMGCSPGYRLQPAIRPTPMGCSRQQGRFPWAADDLWAAAGKEAPTGCSIQRAACSSAAQRGTPSGGGLPAKSDCGLGSGS